jgi:sulfite reductase beta subunit-like hemoprotein
VEDNLGWHEQGDGRSYCAVYVSQGRVKDIEGGPRYRTAFREIAKTLGLPFVITPNTNLIIADIAPDQRAALAAILARHHIAFPGGMTAVRKVAHACVALPTCGLSLSESERVFSGVLDEIDPILRELKLESEPILIRMTGCPNGCARPYNADIGFVGRAPGKYAMFVGGSIRGDRLAGLEKKVVALADIPKEVRVLLEEFAKNRRPDERFTDYWGRTHVNGEAPAPEQFHVEFSERAARQAEARKAPESKPASPEPEPQAVPQESSLVAAQSHIRTLQLDPRSQDGVIFRQRLEIHLPATTDVAVYNAIFKSLREHFGE